MKRLVACLLLLCAPAAPALAHPHVFVSVVSEVLFAPDGKVSGIRHEWKFDDMYSAFVTANLGTDGKDPTPEQMLPIAKTNVESLKEFDFFTFLKMKGVPAKFNDATDYSMTYGPSDQTVTLYFTLPMEPPAPAGKFFVFQVYDPSYFVAFEMERKAPARMKGAPKGCSLNVNKPGALSAADQAKLAASAGTYDTPHEARRKRYRWRARDSETRDIPPVTTFCAMWRFACAAPLATLVLLQRHRAAASGGRAAAPRTGLLAGSSAAGI